MDDAAPLPALRVKLEAVPVHHEGRDAFLLRDLEELSESALSLSPGGLMAATLLDGRRNADEVRDAFEENSGAPLSAEALAGLVKALDEAGYLETPAVAARRAAALAAFRASPRRDAAFAGSAYAREPAALARELDAFFSAEGGPGRGPEAQATLAPPRGLVAPHIDFRRGGTAYAWAYGELSRRRPPDAVLALGVAHASPPTPWAFTPKSYATPLGEVRLDAELYDALSSRVWYEPRADEWVHKNEHSLEFQAVWLRKIWGERTPPWVPVLVSSFEASAGEAAPSSEPTINKAVEDLALVLQEQERAGRRVLVLCGVDFAHVGPRFGDDLEITPELARKIEDADRRCLVDALALDADAFYRAGVGEGAWRKVCGQSALYTGLRLLRALGARPGRLLAYGQAPDPAGGLVSFASAIFD